MLDNRPGPWYDVVIMEVNDGLSLSRDHDTFDKDYFEGWLFRWDDIKWYDSYEEIATLERFVHEATSDEYEFEIDGVKQNSSEFIKFVRLGEDTNDVEMHGDGFWDIHVSRCIEC